MRLTQETRPRDQELIVTEMEDPGIVAGEKLARPAGVGGGLEPGGVNGVTRPKGWIM